MPIEVTDVAITIVGKRGDVELREIERIAGRLAHNELRRDRPRARHGREHRRARPPYPRAHRGATRRETSTVTVC